MESIGEFLRRERIRQNRDLGRIAEELKITVRMLDAIENEQFDKLPGGVFARAFARQYARALGVESDEFNASLDAKLSPEPEPLAMEDAVMPGKGEYRVPPVHEWETVGPRHFAWTGPLRALAGVVAVILVCWAVYTYWQKLPHQSDQLASAPPMQSVTPAPQAVTPVPQAETATPTPGESQMPPNGVAGANPQTAQAAQPAGAVPQPAASVPAAPASTSQPPQQAPVPGATVRVEIRTAEPAWVLARADGQVLFSATIEANQSRVVEGRESVLLRLGNAGGVTVSLNGKALGALGPKGQVRTIQFTSGGFQIVPPKPAVPAPDAL